MCNKPLQQKYGRQRISITGTPVFHQYSAWQKGELIAKTPELWSHHGSVMC